MESISDKIGNKRVFFVSDFHLGNGTASDNFWPVRDRFFSFLNWFEQQEDSVLIIGGDFFELWQADLGEIVSTYFFLLKRLFENENVFILLGNHDWGLKGFLDLAIHNEIINKFSDEFILERGNKEILICHGHRFDPFNSPGRSDFVGRLMSLLMSTVEVKHPNLNIENYSQRHVEPIARKISFFFMNLYSFFFAKTQKEKKGRLIDILDEYHKQYPERLVVSGHTHRPGWYEDWYVNSGTWQENEDGVFYIEITPSGNMSINTWPEHKELYSQFPGSEFSRYSIKKLWENRFKE
jgi:UDP-2,3-diacylglucosamine pyrophosphatase LpxH